MSGRNIINKIKIKSILNKLANIFLIIISVLCFIALLKRFVNIFTLMFAIAKCLNNASINLINIVSLIIACILGLLFIVLIVITMGIVLVLIYKIFKKLFKNPITMNIKVNNIKDVYKERFIKKVPNSRKLYESNNYVYINGLLIEKQLIESLEGYKSVNGKKGLILKLKDNTYLFVGDLLKIFKRYTLIERKKVNSYLKKYGNNVYQLTTTDYRYFKTIREYKLGVDIANNSKYTYFYNNLNKVLEIGLRYLNNTALICLVIVFIIVIPLNLGALIFYLVEVLLVDASSISKIPGLFYGIINLDVVEKASRFIYDWCLALIAIIMLAFVQRAIKLFSYYQKNKKYMSEVTQNEIFDTTNMYGIGNMFISDKHIILNDFVYDSTKLVFNYNNAITIGIVFDDKTVMFNINQLNFNISKVKNLLKEKNL